MNLPVGGGCSCKEIERLAKERDIFRNAANRHLSEIDRLRAQLEECAERLVTGDADTVAAVLDWYYGA